MKKIFVPTDFSLAAKKALDFALEIAKKKNAVISLVHFYQLPVVPTRHLHTADSEEENRISMEAWSMLEREKVWAENRTGVKVEIQSHPILMTTEIPREIVSRDADLIVMGTVGSGRLKKFFLGSNTASVVAMSPRPVLAIPDHAENSSIQRIGFAYDQEPFEDFAQLQILTEMANLFQSHVKIFHIRLISQEKNTASTSQNISQLLEFFKNNPNDYRECPEADLEAGIHKFIKEENIDLLAMIPRNRSIFQRLFRSSMTKIMVFDSPIPILAIPAVQ